MPSTIRSPTRSLARPHGIIEKTEPASEAEMRNPACPSERSNRSRSAGAITAAPNQIPEYVAWANVPAARTTQRYRELRARTD